MCTKHQQSDKKNPRQNVDEQVKETNFEMKLIK